MAAPTRQGRSRARLVLVLAAALGASACGNSRDYQALATALAGDEPDRSINLDEATGPLPLALADDAARAAIGARLFYSSVIDTLGSGGGSGAKSASTENCADGGTRTKDESTTRRSVRYDQCLEGDRYTDGFVEVEITSAGYPTSHARAQIGENDTPLLAENRNPADDFRTLLLGTLVGEVTIDSHGKLKEVDATANLKGAEMDLDGTPRMNYGMDDDRVDVKTDGNDLLIDESGNFRLSGDCGVGQANVATRRVLRVNQDSGAVTDGELVLTNAGGDSATATFNADQSVDVAAPSGSMHYSLEEFRGLCPF